MGQAEQIIDFLKSMRIVFINAGVYRGDHPVFLKAIEDLFQKVRLLVVSRGSLEIGVKPQELVIENNILKGEKLYQDIASLFHLRKVKGVTIKATVTREELGGFFLTVSLPPAQIRAEGGLTAMLKKNGISEIAVSELDYSGLLHSGEQSQTMDVDVWEFLLNNLSSFNPDEGDDERFKVQLRNVFDGMNIAAGTADQRLMEKFEKVISSLKEKNPAKSSLIDKELVHMVFDKKSQLGEKGLAHEIRSLINTVGEDDLLDVLWERLFEKDDFNPVVFNVFSVLTGGRDEKAMLERWKRKVGQETDTLKARTVQEKLNNMFVLEGSEQFITDMYKSTLAFLSQSLQDGQQLFLDQKEIFKSELYVLLNLLSSESEPEFAGAIVDAVLREYVQRDIFSDGVVLRSFIDVLGKKVDGVPALAGLTAKKNQLLALIEQSILDNDKNLEREDFEAFIFSFDSPAYSEDYYLSKIFENKNSRLQVMRMMFKCFPDSFSRLAEEIKKRLSQPRLFTEVAISMIDVDFQRAEGFLTALYPAANPLLKLELLKIMRHFPSIEQSFLAETLKDDSPLIRKEAVNLLKVQPPQTLREGISVLLFFFNPLGIFNGTLVENINLLREAELRDAAESLRILRKKWFLFGGDTVCRAIDSALRGWSDHGT